MSAVEKSRKKFRRSKLSNARILRQKKSEEECGDITKEREDQEEREDRTQEDKQARYRKAKILLKNAIAKVKERKVRLLCIHIYKRVIRNNTTVNSHSTSLFAFEKNKRLTIVPRTQE